MFRKFLLIGALLMTASCSGKTPASPAPGVEGFDFAQAVSQAEAPLVTRLENGMTVLVKEDDRFPLVNVRLYVHAGSAYEDPSQAGISHLLEHMVFKGSANRAPGETARRIESVGGSLNAGTSWDYTTYYVEVPDTEWKLGLDTVRDLAFLANIDPKELEPEKEVVLSELERGEDAPGSKLFKTLQGMVWPGTSYEWPIIGFRDTVSKLHAQDIKDYIARLYQPQSMLLTITGKVDAAKVMDEVRATYGQFKNTHDVKPVTPRNRCPLPRERRSRSSPASGTRSISASPSPFRTWARPSPPAWKCSANCSEATTPPCSTVPSSTTSGSWTTSRPTP